MKRSFVIVAAGTGARFGSNTPKQFQLLHGKPVLFYSVEKSVICSDEVIVVLPEEYLSHWKKLCDEFSFHLPHKITPGGVTRAESVRCGLLQIREEGVTAVHDAARPLATTKLINECFALAEKNGSAIPSLPLSDSLRMQEKHTSSAMDRNLFRTVQTPQCFHTKKIIDAYKNLPDTGFTDDASLFEAAGYTVFLVPGEETNIKITQPADMLIAETFLRHSIV